MAELGSYSLRIALLLAVTGLCTAVYAGRRGNANWQRVADRAVWATFAFVSVAMGALFTAFATHDFGIAYVASHSARSMDLSYRLAALWGGQDGSLLLWLWILLAYATACVLVNRHRNRKLMPWVVAVLLANAIFFLALLLGVTDPFEKLPPDHVMSDGRGLNPLLQHPVMLIHPLMLYTGLVGFVIPYAFAFATLVTGELGTQWFRTTRRSTLFAWTFLSIGVVLGGRWAYEVLGWGGYWAWDPVENASFMPWLTATAYLHSVMIQEKRNMLKTWNLLLIGLTYSLCLFGTFLTRSGIVQSVHAFAQTPIFTGLFLGYVLVTMTFFGAALWFRRKGLRSPNQLESMLSREASFLLNNWVFVAILMVIFWGTLFPVFSEALSGQRIAVGPKFFNTMAGPLALLLLLLTGVGPLIAWRRANAASLRRQFLWPIVACAAMAGLLLLTSAQRDLYGLAAWSLGSFALTAILQDFSRAIRARMRGRKENPFRAIVTLLVRNQQRYGGYVVHIGAILILMGTAGSVLNVERLQNIQPGAEIELGEYRLLYLNAEAIPAQHYGGAVARLALYRGDEGLAVMQPEKRMYWLEEQPASIPSVYSTLREDVYVILTAIESDGSATVKVYRNPLVNWIWIGAVVFVLGCIIVMWPHPERRTRREAQ